MASLSREIIRKSITLVRARTLIQSNNLWRQPLVALCRPIAHARLLSTTKPCDCVEGEEQVSHDEDSELQEGEDDGEFKHQFVHNFHGAGRITTLHVDVDTSIRYMDSPAYLRTYGTAPVWKPYRRNFRGKAPPMKIRKTCRRGKYIMSNPCPICRDEYLVVDKKNVKLLEQFRDPISGDIFPAAKIGVCMKQYKKLRTSVLEAYDHGTMIMPVPFRRYNYGTYYKNLPHTMKQQEDGEKGMSNIKAVMPNFSILPTKSRSHIGRVSKFGEKTDASWSTEQIKELDTMRAQEKDTNSMDKESQSKTEETK